MTVDRVSEPAAPRISAADVAMDGLFTGAIGAFIVAIWFFILDVAQGRPLYTPALLGTVLLHGGSAGAQPVTVAPLEVAAYTAFHFILFVIVGVVFAYLMSLMERFPMVGFVLLVLGGCLTVGFFVLDIILGAQLTGKLPAWSVVAANLLAAGAMAFYQLRRHPSVLKAVDRIWEEEDQQAR